MINNLVIVESPAKAKTIEKFLGSDFIVKSSMGHIRDLSKEDLGIDISNNFKPRYIVPPDKKKIVSELRDLVKKAGTVWLASDEDREGEAIAWHLFEELKIKNDNVRRIVFHEITKEAILHAIKNYRKINTDLVNAQQARRVLDRLVGFEISPILWRKVKPSLSAGRVQSVAVRLIVEREREIMQFKVSSAYKVSAFFYIAGQDEKAQIIKAGLNKRFNTIKEAHEFLESSKDAVYKVSGVTKKPAKKTPAPPFTTSTLQQEASRKLGFSVSQTMMIAQKLYEAGRITYMRTDSVNLSNLALNAIEENIVGSYGSDYFQSRHFKTKTRGAQEAHEAIRPTYPGKQEIPGSSQEKRLYDLIWKRTIASQMADARIEKTSITIDISNRPEIFVAEGEVLLFEGFLKVYMESTDDEHEEGSNELLPPVKTGMELGCKNIEALQRFTHHPPRYTEASLVKKLEELGIGRPSTYAPTISTIQQRGYIIKEDRQGTERKFKLLTLEKGNIKEENKTEITGSEKMKLFPDNIGMLVNDFLMEHFSEILDYNFTASVEKEFDEIAEGKMEWAGMISKFYDSFHGRVEYVLENAGFYKPERLLGDDPATGLPVYVRMARFGAVAQIGETNGEKKPKYARLRKGQHLESITLDEALNLFKLPRLLGKYEDKDVSASVGRFGPYVVHDSKFYSLPKDNNDPYTIDLNSAIEIIETKREKDKNRVIREFEEDSELFVLNGRWGPYISYKKMNYKIPRGVNAGELDYAECKKIIESTPAAKKKTRK